MRSRITLKELEFVKENYGEFSVVEISTLLGCNRKRVAGIVKRYKLTKDKPVFPKHQGQQNKFKKGNKTSAMFSVGHKPYNVLPDNSIRGKNIGFNKYQKQIKINGVWQNYCKWLYSVVNQTEIVSTDIVEFIDGDKSNENPDNLRILSRKEFIIQMKKPIQDIINRKIKIGQDHYKRKQAIKKEIESYNEARLNKQPN